MKMNYVMECSVSVTNIRKAIHVLVLTIVIYIRYVIAREVDNI